MDLRDSARQASLFADPITNRIAEFLLEIGLLVRRGDGCVASHTRTSASEHDPRSVRTALSHCSGSVRFDPI